MPTGLDHLALEHAEQRRGVPGMLGDREVEQSAAPGLALYKRALAVDAPQKPLGGRKYQCAQLLAPIRTRIQRLRRALELAESGEEGVLFGGCRAPVA